jgi:hypothetical protein
VDSLVRYISADPKVDRDRLLRGEKLPLADLETSRRFCFRNLFIKGDDVAIGRIVQNYFDAVKTKWPRAWDNFDEGAMLNKTNGFRALMAIFGRAYNSIATPGEMVQRRQFEAVFARSSFKDSDFNTGEFVPGTGGEVKLRNALVDQLFS